MNKDAFKKEMKAAAETGLALMVITGLICLDAEKGKDVVYPLLTGGAVVCLGVICWTLR